MLALSVTGIVINLNEVVLMEAVVKWRQSLLGAISRQLLSVQACHYETRKES